MYSFMDFLVVYRYTLVEREIHAWFVTIMDIDDLYVLSSIYIVWDMLHVGLIIPNKLSSQLTNKERIYTILLCMRERVKETEASIK